MTQRVFHFGTLGELPPNESARAHLWHRRLHWPLLAAILLTVPAFYLESLGTKLLPSRAGWGLYLIATLCFGAYLGWMLHLCKHRSTFALRNWLDITIFIGLTFSLAGSFGDWSPGEWAFRLGVTILVAIRLVFLLKGLFSPSGTVYLLGIGVITLGLSGLGFYWLEPTINSYGDGLWLAFVTGATVGYGDVVPTTPASRIFAVFMVLLGFALLSLVTASIAAFFVGEDEKQLRQEFHTDMKQLHDEIRALRRELDALRNTRSSTNPE